MSSLTTGFLLGAIALHGPQPACIQSDYRTVRDVLREMGYPAVEAHTESDGVVDLMAFKANGRTGVHLRWEPAVHGKPAMLCVINEWDGSAE